MSVTVQSAVIVGVKAVSVTVEVDLLRRLPCLVIVGAPSTTVRESAERVRSAILAAGFEMPRQRIVVSLSPADLRKSGTGLDLAIAVGILVASGQVSAGAIKGKLFIGELSLGSDLRPVRGALAFGALAQEQELSVVGPEDMTGPIHDCGAVASFGVRSLVEAVNPGMHVRPRIVPVGAACSLQMSDVRGLDVAIAQLTEAAATRRTVVLRGRPGCGKTMLAARASGLLPVLSPTEALEVATIHDCAGLRTLGVGAVARTFRAPHHTVSVAGLLGGSNLIPGEATLAHRGVMFLDEFLEFPRVSTEALRCLADGAINVSRVGGSTSLPCDAWLIVGVNPCPCGHLGTARCQCSADSIARYDARWQQSPLLRGAMVIDLEPVVPSVLLSPAFFS